MSEKKIRTELKKITLKIHYEYNPAVLGVHKFLFQEQKIGTMRVYNVVRTPSIQIVVTLGVFIML